MRQRTPIDYGERFGVLGAVRAARRQLGAMGEPGLVPLMRMVMDQMDPPDPTLPRTKNQLFDLLAVDVRRHVPVKEMLRRYQWFMVRLGLLRNDSTDRSALRRLQELLKEGVYDVRVPSGDLAPHVQAGRLRGRSRSAS